MALSKSKTPGPSRRRKKGDTGKRYSDEEKRKILDFVKAHGYGGISAASIKFKVSYLALRRWLDSSGAKSPKGAIKAAKPSKRLANSLKKAEKAVKTLRKQITALRSLLNNLP